MREELQARRPPTQWPQLEPGFQHLKCETKKKGPQSFNIFGHNCVFFRRPRGHFAAKLMATKRGILSRNTIFY